MAVSRHQLLAASHQSLQTEPRTVSSIEPRLAPGSLVLTQQARLDPRGKTGEGVARPSWLTTASAASSVQPPAKTARRRMVCSSWVSKSWLQAMASRIVCCRAGRRERLASTAASAFQAQEQRLR